MADGCLTQWGPEELADIERGWEEQDGPSAPAPPMANVHLAVELATGLDAVRDFEFQGQTLRLKPTPYPTAIRLLAWMQQLERLEAMGKADPQLLGERLLELRDCYAELASLAGSLILDREDNPFLDAEPIDFHRIAAVALDPGNEIRARAPRSDGTLNQYDAAFYLYRYLERFGSIPGMVTLENGRPQPATWRHFVQAMNYLRRADAEAALQMFGAAASAQGGGEGAKRWIETQSAATGLS